MQPVPTRHPVLRYLAVVRSARDFGLTTDALDPLALRFHPAGDAVDALAEAASSSVLAGREPERPRTS